MRKVVGRDDEPAGMSLRLVLVENGLFLTSARRANMLAARLASGVRDLPGATLAAPVEANEVFLEVPEAAIDGLIADGFLF